jgi:hypothetical protein
MLFHLFLVPSFTLKKATVPRFSDILFKEYFSAYADNGSKKGPKAFQANTWFGTPALAL